MYSNFNFVFVQFFFTLFETGADSKEIKIVCEKWSEIEKILPQSLPPYLLLVSYSIWLFCSPF